MKLNFLGNELPQSENQLSLSDKIKKLYSLRAEILSDMAKGFSFEQLFYLKEDMSSQKFSSSFWNLTVSKVLDLNPCKSFDKFDKFDYIDGNKQTVESKYSTYNKEFDSYSFPQFIRTNITPDYYIIFMFTHNDLVACKVPGNAMINSIIYKKSTPSHNGSKNEKRVNIKENSLEMKWLLGYRDLNIESKFKNHKYSLHKEINV